MITTSLSVWFSAAIKSVMLSAWIRRHHCFEQKDVGGESFQPLPGFATNFCLALQHGYHLPLQNLAQSGAEIACVSAVITRMNWPSAPLSKVCSAVRGSFAGWPLIFTRLN